MNTRGNITSIHNFYFRGNVDNYNSGKITDKISRENLPPTKFNFGETIQEVGLDTKLKFKNYKFYNEFESIVVSEPFHFKDFDRNEINIWTYFELLFHQWFLYGVSFNTNKIEIYEKLRNYLVDIHGECKKIPDQENSSNTVAWFLEEFQTSIYLEIEQKGNGERFIVLTYYDNLLHMSLKYNHNAYNIVRGEAYKKDRKKIITQKNTGIFSKLFKRITNQKNQVEIDFESIKSHCENILSNNNSKIALIEISNYVLSNIKPINLNLEIGDWLLNISVKIQDKGLFVEAENVYNLFINWQKSSDFTPSKEKIELISSVYNNLINHYEHNNKNDEAITSFENCIKLVDENKTFLTNYNYAFIVGRANYNIARVYNNIKENKKAILHSKRALDYFEHFVSPWINSDEIATIILTINNLGNYYSEIDSYDEAVQMYAMGLRFAFEQESHYASSVLNMNLANTWVKQKKHKEAENQYYIILDLINKGPNIYKGTPLKGDVLINMADMYNQTKEKEKEIECLDKAILFYENALTEHPEMEDLIIKLNKRKLSIL